MLAKFGPQTVRKLACYCRGTISNRSIWVSAGQNVCFENAKLLFNFSRKLCKNVDSSTPKTRSTIESSQNSEIDKRFTTVEKTAENNNAESDKLSSKLEKLQNSTTSFVNDAKSDSSFQNSTKKGKLINNEVFSKNDSIVEPNSDILKSGVHSLKPENYPCVSRFHLPSNWRKDHLGAQGIKFPGTIYVIKSIQDELKHIDVLEELLKEKVLGFDTEHCPIQHLVCVVQLATHDKAVLWQCINFKKKMPYFLREMLVGDIKKVGHACMDDAIMISKQFKEEPQNLVDTNCWARDLHCSPQSLQGLCAIFLGQHLSKTHQQSNWKKDKLSPGQIRYAATDAWISLKVYEEMKRHAEELSVPLTPMYKTLQERYQEVSNSRRLKRRRRRQRIKEKNQEKKAKTQQQLTDGATQELNSNSQETSSYEIIPNSTNENLSSKEVVLDPLCSASMNFKITNADLSSKEVVLDPSISSASKSSEINPDSSNENSSSKEVAQEDVSSKTDSDSSVKDQEENEFLNTVDPTTVIDAEQDNGVSKKKSIGSRQRHKRFLLKFHSLE